MRRVEIKIKYFQEHMSRSMQLNYISVTAFFIDRFIFRPNLLWMRLPWECHNQSQDTNWRHGVTGPELPFFYKREGVLKIDQSVKMPWHRLSMRVASSCSSAPGILWVMEYAMNFKGNKTVVEARICACHFYCPGASSSKVTPVEQVWPCWNSEGPDISNVAKTLTQKK